MALTSFKRIALVSALALSAALPLTTRAQATLLNVSYDVAREYYKALMSARKLVDYEEKLANVA